MSSDELVGPPRDWPMTIRSSARPARLLDAAGRLPEAQAAGAPRRQAAAAPGGGAPVQFVDVCPKTADGRVHLFPADVDVATTGCTPTRRIRRPTRYPLSLISPAASTRSRRRSANCGPAIARLKMHPDDAHARVDRRRRLRPRVQRSGRSALRGQRHAGDAAGHRVAAEGPVGPEHVQRRHRRTRSCPTP